MLDNNDPLKNMLNDLPNLLAPDMVWTEIENELLFEKNSFAFRQAINDLPISSKKDLSWEALQEYGDKMYPEKNLKSESNLPTAIPIGEINLKKSRYDRFNSWFWPVAATILIGAFTWLINIHPKESVEISITQESKDALTPFEIGNQWSETDETLEFILENCQNLNTICSMPEFEILMDNYLDLDRAKQEILAELNGNQEQIQLVKYLVRIEKEKNSIGQRLIKMVLS